MAHVGKWYGGTSSRDRGGQEHSFDYAISIATIHHLSTPARRKLAVQRLIECISPSHGRALIYVWAIEQDELSKRNIPTDSSSVNHHATSNTQAEGQDVFVPWVLSSQTAKNKAAPSPPGEGTVKPSQVFNRYYHMFAPGELKQLVEKAVQDMGLVVGSRSAGQGRRGGLVRGLEVVQDGWERSNYYVEVRRWECNS